MEIPHSWHPGTHSSDHFRVSTQSRSDVTGFQQSESEQMVPHALLSSATLVVLEAFDPDLYLQEKAAHFKSNCCSLLFFSLMEIIGISFKLTPKSGIFLLHWQIDGNVSFLWGC